MRIATSLLGITYALFFGLVTVYGSQSTTKVIGKIVNNSGTTSISINIAGILTDPNHRGSVACGLQGDLAKSSTIYFYGYADSYSVNSIGGNSSYTLGYLIGYRTILDGFGFGDNYKVAFSSPTIMTINVGAGASVGYTLQGVVYK